ncbi:hypothetical protein BDV10DRAFT_166521 [Aspergillus recurvatus]
MRINRSGTKGHRGGNGISGRANRIAVTYQFRRMGATLFILIPIPAAYSIVSWPAWIYLADVYVQYADIKVYSHATHDEYCASGYNGKQCQSVYLKF